MQTKHIEKLEDLKDFKWTYNGKDFILSCVGGGWILIQENFIDFQGKIKDLMLMTITFKNLSELEFYGLKVILNEKPNPKLTREEREYLSAEWYIARDDDGKLFFYHMYPKRNEEYKEWEPNVESRACALEINRTLFPFITWESGKAWSKSELLELEVVE